MFLSISLNTCFGCSKEQAHRDSYIEYPQHMFWLRNKKNKFSVTHSYLGACFANKQFGSKSGPTEHPIKPAQCAVSQNIHLKCIIPEQCSVSQNIHLDALYLYNAHPSENRTGIPTGSHRDPTGILNPGGIPPGY